MLQFLLILESPLWVALEQCLVMISWLGGGGWGMYCLFFYFSKVFFFSLTLFFLFFSCCRNIYIYISIYIICFIFLEKEMVTHSSILA